MEKTLRIAPLVDFFASLMTNLSSMKIKLFLVLFCTANLFNAQSGFINSIEIIPASPTAGDSVKLVGHFTFSNGGCAKQSFVASIFGTAVMAEAIHCLGMLTIICYESDTIDLGLLAAGVYSVDLSLYTGFGLTPCTTATLAAADSRSFTVSSPTLIPALEFDFKIVPNPTTKSVGFITINGEDFFGEPVRVFGSNGQLLKETIFSEHCILDIVELSAGLYFIQIGGKHKSVSSERLVIE